MGELVLKDPTEQGHIQHKLSPHSALQAETPVCQHAPGSLLFMMDLCQPLEQLLQDILMHPENGMD